MRYVDALEFADDFGIPGLIKRISTEEALDALLDTSEVIANGGKGSLYDHLNEKTGLIRSIVSDVYYNRYSSHRGAEVAEDLCEQVASASLRGERDRVLELLEADDSFPHDELHESFMARLKPFAEWLEGALDHSVESSFILDSLFEAWNVELQDAIFDADTSSPGDAFLNDEAVFLGIAPGARGLARDNLHMSVHLPGRSMSSVTVKPDLAFARLLAMLNIPVSAYIAAVARLHKVDLTSHPDNEELAMAWDALLALDSGASPTSPDAFRDEDLANAVRGLIDGWPGLKAIRQAHGEPLVMPANLVSRLDDLSMTYNAMPFFAASFQMTDVLPAGTNRIGLVGIRRGGPVLMLHNDYNAGYTIGLELDVPPVVDLSDADIFSFGELTSHPKHGADFRHSDLSTMIDRFLTESSVVLKSDTGVVHKIACEADLCAMAQIARMRPDAVCARAMNSAGGGLYLVVDHSDRGVAVYAAPAADGANEFEAKLYGHLGEQVPQHAVELLRELCEAEGLSSSALYSLTKTDLTQAPSKR